MASSTSTQEHQTLQTSYDPTAAPPPTPSTHNHLPTSDATAEALSLLLHRLPPILSLPSRRSPSTSSHHLPLISLSTLPTDFISSSSKLNPFFQITDHTIPSQLALSAENQALSLFHLSRPQKQQSFPKNWPLGFDDEDDDDESFCLDASSPTESSEFSITSLHELALSLEKIALQIMESIFCDIDFENPKRFRSLMWITDGISCNKPNLISRSYPYILGLQYQIRCRKYSLLTDSGWVSVSPQVDSVLVTVGDIAQVWSNGMLKKVRGRPVAISQDEDEARCISMALLVTLPTESIVGPLLPAMVNDEENAGGGDYETDGNGSSVDKEREEEMNEKKFNSFSFEDYAWRVYHERLHFKDPLDKYRI